MDDLYDATERDAPRDFEGHACRWCEDRRWPDDMVTVHGRWFCDDACAESFAEDTAAEGKAA